MKRTKTAKAASKIYYEQPHAKRAALLADIPSELKKRRIWLLWKGVYQSEKDKWDKIPYYINHQPRRGQNGSDEDRAQLSDFKSALAVLKSNPQYAGLGIALLSDEGVVAVDVDNLNANPDAANLAKELSGITYTETSPSGNGGRALFIGKARSLKKPPVEIFGTTGFVTITGWKANGKPLADVQKAANLLDAHFNKQTTSVAQPPAGEQPKVSSRKLREVLEDIPNDDLPYDEWLQVIMGIHDARRGDSVGRKLAEEWSRSSDKHDDKKFNQSWESFARRVSDAPRVTFGTLCHMAGWKSEKQQHEQPPVRLDVLPLSLTELDTPVEPPQFAVRPLLPLAALTDFPGAHGTGKSTLALWMAMHVAIGRAWCGLPVRQGPTVFLSREDGRADILRRVQALADAMRLAADEKRALLANLRIIGKEQSRGFRLTAKEFGACRVIPAAVATVAEVCRGAVCVVLETAARLHGGDELNEDLGVLADACEQVAGETGAAVVLVRHVSKAAARGGETDSYAGRGGGAFADAARSVIVLTQLSPEEARSEGVDLAQLAAGDPTAAVLKLTHGKLSHEARSEPLYLLRTRGPRLRHMQARGRAAVNKDRLADYIRAVEKDGEQYTARDLEKKAGEIGVPKRTVRHLLSELEADGYIRTREVPPRGKHGRPAAIYVHTGKTSNSAPLRPTPPQHERGAVMGGHGTGGATPPHPVPMGAWGGVKPSPAGARPKRRSGATAPQQLPKSGAQLRVHGGRAKARTAGRKRAR